MTFPDLPCSDADPSQRWLYNATAHTFSPLLAPSYCLEMSSSAVLARVARVAPCAPIAAAAAAAAGARAPAAVSSGVIQRFAWEGRARRYCISLFSATHFKIRRCLRAAPFATGLTVALRAGGAAGEAAGGSSCLTAPGRFRMLEPAACNADDARQRFWYDGATRALRSAADVSLCLRYFGEAGSFAAWACEPGQPEQMYQHSELDEGPMDHTYCSVTKLVAGREAACVGVLG